MLYFVILYTCDEKFWEFGQVLLIRLLFIRICYFLKISILEKLFIQKPEEKGHNGSVDETCAIFRFLFEKGEQTDWN